MNTQSPTLRKNRLHAARRLTGAVVLLASLVPGCSASAAAAHPDGLFARHDIALDAGGAPTLLTGRFLGRRGAELAVVRIDGNGHRQLRLYAFDSGGWGPVLEARLRPEVAFVDVARSDGGDRLLTWGNGRLAAFDPAAETERTLVDVPTPFRARNPAGSYVGAEAMDPSHGADIPSVDVTRDLTGDGLDDLVVPDLDGFWISTQAPDGAFSPPVKLGPPEPFLDERGFEETRSYREAGIDAVNVPWYLSRVHRMDHDGDGRLDLAFWDSDHFDVHHLGADGSFDPVAQTVTVDVPFESDGAYSLLFGWGDRSTSSLLFGGSTTRRTILHSLVDVDGDGTTDLVTHTLKGRNIIGLRSTFEVHFGTPTAGGLTFAREAGASFQPPGKGAAALETSGYSSNRLTDLDGDGRLDLALRRVRMGLGGILHATVGHGISLDLSFYRFARGPIDEPTARHRVRPDFAPFEGDDVFFPSVCLGDVDDDGRSDLVVGRDWDELQILRGVGGPALFEDDPYRVAIDVPHDERNIWLADLDRDGKQDVLLHYAPRGDEELHRVTTLFSR